MGHWPNTPKRFWTHIHKQDTLNGCWLWIGTVDRYGYGRFAIKGKQFLAHRIAYELTYGKIPDGLLCCHHCDNPRCVRPDHLFIGTNSDNMIDAYKKGRLRQLSPFTSQNTRGSNNANAKLTKTDILEIRYLRYDGFSQGTIAKRFNVSVSTIKDILHKRTWNHVIDSF